MTELSIFETKSPDIKYLIININVIIFILITNFVEKNMSHIFNESIETF